MSAKTSQRFQDLKHLTQSEKWVYWPVCPVIRRENGEKKMGMVMVHDEGYTVYECNMFMCMDGEVDLEKVPSHNYSTAKEIVDDNWEVD